MPYRPSAGGGWGGGVPVDSHDEEQVSNRFESNRTVSIFCSIFSQEISNKVRGLEYQPATKKSLVTHNMEAVNVLYLG